MVQFVIHLKSMNITRCYWACSMLPTKRPMKMPIYSSSIILKLFGACGMMWIEPKNKDGTPRKKNYWKFKQWITWCYPNNWSPNKTKFTRASRAIIWMTKASQTNIKQIVQPYRNPWDCRGKGSWLKERKGQHCM